MIRFQGRVGFRVHQSRVPQLPLCLTGGFFCSQPLVMPRSISQSSEWKFTKCGQKYQLSTHLEGRAGFCHSLHYRQNKFKQGPSGSLPKVSGFNSRTWPQTSDSKCPVRGSTFAKASLISLDRKNKCLRGKV